MLAINQTLPKETKLNVGMAVLDHAREGVLLNLDVNTLLADGKRQEVRAVLYSACRVEQEGGAIMEISPLRIAASNRHDQAVKLLLEAIRKLFVIT